MKNWLKIKVNVKMSYTMPYATRKEELDVCLNPRTSHIPWAEGKGIPPESIIDISDWKTYKTNSLHHIRAVLSIVVYDGPVPETDGVRDTAPDAVQDAVYKIVGEWARETNVPTDDMTIVLYEMWDEEGVKHD